MRLTKLGHACVRLEKDGRRLVIDPGSLSGPDAVAGADAVLITHEHPDHVVEEQFSEAAAGIDVWTTPGVAERLDGVDARIHRVGDGDSFESAGFEVAVAGRLHAVVNPALPPVANVGFLVDGRVFHPGDAFTVPHATVDTLLIPTNAPWMKASELIDYVNEIGPRRAFSVHDGFLNDAGLKLVDGLLGSLAEERETDIRRLPPGTSLDLD
jgi:L-ascorbate metabolism protein UlaG (beta-lactamase superfamily)